MEQFPNTIDEVRLEEKLKNFLAGIKVEVAGSSFNYIFHLKPEDRTAILNRILKSTFFTQAEKNFIEGIS